MLMTNAQLKNVLLSNFADNRCTSILLFIRDMLERKKHGGGVEQYRLTNTDNNSKITTVDEFIAAIDENKLSMKYYAQSERMGGDRIHPFCVTVENVRLDLTKYSDEDNPYFMSGKPTKIVFMVNYLSDADPALPLKIFDIKLTS